MSTWDTDGQPSSTVWSESALRAFWERELNFPEHYFSNKYGGQIISRLRPYISAGDKVLDYGCGRGTLSARLCRDMKAEVWATDRLDAAVRTTERTNSGLPGFRGAYSLEVIRTSAERFDAIVAVELLEHLTDEDLGDFFANSARLLRGSGHLIVTTPNRERLASKSVLCPSCRTVFHRWQHLRSVDGGQLELWGAKVGLTLKWALETDLSRPEPAFPWLRRRVSEHPPPHLIGIFAHSREA